MKIERRNLQDFSPKFAAKPQSFLNPLIINTLQNGRIFRNFVKYFYQFHPIPLPTFSQHFQMKKQAPTDAVETDSRSRRFQASEYILVTPTFGGVGSYVGSTTRSFHEVGTYFMYVRPPRHIRVISDIHKVCPYYKKKEYII